LPRTILDGSVLRHLTDQDLKELGVSLGHRRKMLAVIAELIGTWRDGSEILVIKRRASIKKGVFVKSCG
jgi:hypothetical protein